MPNLPTRYLLWASGTPGSVNLGVWDVRMLDQSKPPGAQLETALFHDLLPLNLLLQMGSSFIQYGVGSMETHLVSLRQAHIQRFAEDHQRKPVSPEELARMSAYVHGLSDVDLDLPSEDSPPQEGQ